MTMISKPMLAGKCEDVSKLVYPVLATPKLDGIRCLVIDGKAVSRKFKPIPNDHIRQSIEQAFVGYRGEFDGEIMVRGRSFNDLSGDVRRSDGKPDFFYAVFDHVIPDTEQNVVDGSVRASPWGGLSTPYNERVKMLQAISLPDFCVKILPVSLRTAEELGVYEASVLAEGYEGIMVRSLGSPYKCGRSTANEGYLLKIKRFDDDEGKIVGYEELMHNDNVAGKDAFGRTERSSHKENLRPAGTLGKLICRNSKWPEDFGVGTGYDAKTRDALWAIRDQLVANKTLMKFKHQPSASGEKALNRPRFPVFLGLRDAWDYGE